jgi:hypothetical protein
MWKRFFEPNRDAESRAYRLRELATGTNVDLAMLMATRGVLKDRVLYRGHFFKTPRFLSARRSIVSEKKSVFEYTALVYTFSLSETDMGMIYVPTLTLRPVVVYLGGPKYAEREGFIGRCLREVVRTDIGIDRVTLPARFVVSPTRPRSNALLPYLVLLWSRAREGEGWGPARLDDVRAADVYAALGRLVSMALDPRKVLRKGEEKGRKDLPRIYSTYFSPVAEVRPIPPLTHPPSKELLKIHYELWASAPRLTNASSVWRALDGRVAGKEETEAGGSELRLADAPEAYRGRVSRFLGVAQEPPRFAFSGQVKTPTTGGGAEEGGDGAEAQTQSRGVHVTLLTLPGADDDDS